MKDAVKEFNVQFADVVIRKGINLRKGQSLLIKSSPLNYGFAQELASRAYECGAAYVYIDIQDYQLARKRIDSQDIEALKFVPHFSRAIQFEALSEDWAYIRIDNTEDRDQLTGVDTEKLSAYQGEVRKDSTILRTAFMRHEHAWCVVCAPGPAWAKQILGDTATTEDLCEVLSPILRLDADDPVAAWDTHAARLGSLCEELNGRKIKSFHYTDSRTGTDFTVGFSQKALWEGGPKPLPSGRLFFPNMPTEEVFTVPDRMTAEGVLVTTKPVTIFGSQVDGCRFTFKDGKVIDYSAEVGGEILKKFIETDDGASYLGEIALVDGETPIAKSEQVFHSILFDENAASHFALGAGYPDCLSNGKSLTTDEELRAEGCNTSMLHTDFMIGSPTMQITAVTYDGEAVEIMKDGILVLNS